MREIMRAKNNNMQPMSCKTNGGEDRESGGARLQEKQEGEEKEPSDILRGGREEKQRTAAQREGINSHTQQQRNAGETETSPGTTRDRFLPHLHSDPHPNQEEGPVLDHHFSSALFTLVPPESVATYLAKRSLSLLEPPVSSSHLVPSGKQMKNTTLLSQQTASCHFAELRHKNKPT